MAFADATDGAACDCWLFLTLLEMIVTDQKSVQKIGKLFGSLGIQKVQNPTTFWRRVHKDFPKLAAELDSAIEARSAGAEAPIHEIKNKDAGFANLVFSQFDSDRTREFLTWLVREEILFSGAKVADLGCDNGVFLCVCAILFPDVQFQGFDICENALDVANQRKESLSLENVSFSLLASESWDEVADGSFDVVFTQFVMHEVLNEQSVSSLRDIGEVKTSGFEFTPVETLLSIDNQKMEYFGSIRRALKSTGMYISVERVPTAHAFHLWNRALSESDFQVDYARSYKLPFTNHEKEQEIVPVTVAMKSEGVPVPVWNDDLSFWMYDEFLKHKQLTSITDPAVAEAVYLALDRKVAATVQLIWKNGSGTMRKVFGSAGAIGFCYTTTNQNYRTLTLVPSTCLNEIGQKEVLGISQLAAGVEMSVEIQDQSELDRLGLTDSLRLLQTDTPDFLRASSI
jgi:hypothetical protein